jgi:hypothetical protein
MSIPRVGGHVLKIPVDNKLYSQLLDLKQATKTPVSEIGRLAIEAYLDSLEAINEQP